MFKMAWAKSFKRQTPASTTTSEIKKVSIASDVKPGLMIFLGDVYLKGEKKEFQFKTRYDMTQHDDKYRKTLVMQSFQMSDDGEDAKVVFHYHDGEDAYELVFDSKDMKAPKNYKAKTLLRVEAKKI